jgi:hypothetical protein
MIPAHSIGPWPLALLGCGHVAACAFKTIPKQPTPLPSCTFFSRLFCFLGAVAVSVPPPPHPTSHMGRSGDGQKCLGWGKSCHYKLRASPAKATMELPFARNYPAATSELLLRGETTRCSLRRVSAMGTPLVQLSHPARLWGAESGTA